MAEKNTAAAKVILYKSKKLKEGKHPIVLRVTYQRIRKYFTLGIEAKPNEWNTEKGELRGRREENILIQNFEAKACNIIIDMERMGAPFSFDAFKRKFFTKSSAISVFTYFDRVIKELYEAKRVGTADSYRFTLMAIKRFRTNRDLLFNDIDYSFLTKFERFLKPTCKINSIAVYMKTLKAVVNRAIKEEILSKDLYPFENYSIKTEKTKKRALTHQQIKLFAEFETDEGSAQWHAKNFFIFSYLTQGMNFIDLAKLKWSENIIDNRIVYTRSKTGEGFSIKIQPPVQHILNRYKKQWGNGSDFIFPILEPSLTPRQTKRRVSYKLKTTNKGIKAIAKQLNIEHYTSITFYVARHTYATVLKRNGTPISLISDALGHQTEKITQVYLDSFENEAMDKANENLL